MISILHQAKFPSPAFSSPLHCKCTHSLTIRIPVSNTHAHDTLMTGDDLYIITFKPKYFAYREIVVQLPMCTRHLYKGNRGHSDPFTRAWRSPSPPTVIHCD